MSVSDGLYWLSIASAIVAAGLWFRWATFQVPIQIAREQRMRGITDRELEEIQRKQSRWNVGGAIAAAIAALAQGASWLTL